MRFAALPVLMDENVHCAPVLENHPSCLIRAEFSKPCSYIESGFLANSLNTKLQRHLT